MTPEERVAWFWSLVELAGDTAEAPAIAEALKMAFGEEFAAQVADSILTWVVIEPWDIDE